MMGIDVKESEKKPEVLIEEEYLQQKIVLNDSEKQYLFRVINFRNDCCSKKKCSYSFIY